MTIDEVQRKIDRHQLELEIHFYISEFQYDAMRVAQSQASVHDKISGIKDKACVLISHLLDIKKMNEKLENNAQ